ncbi:MAG TPA: response regulator transcription factor, partial [Candidatus Dormibacteraeota bacterium]|nr:response regulator transcription factor [Candidatus Dormibacteraeota bacterium]
IIVRTMQILPKVLLVEDDRSIASALSQALQSSYDIDTATTGQMAFYKTDASHYDIVVLDLDLPDMSGLAICQRLREGGFRTPILILTADSRTLTKINLLDAGANDYLTKPFSLGEFKARLRALTRAGHQIIKPPNKLAISGLELNRKTHEVSRDGMAINLRRKEFVMLECLMEHAGSVVTRRALTRYAWHGAEDLWTNTVDVHIKHLRDKIDRPFDKPLIRTVHGIGYRLEVIQTAFTEKT